MITRENKVERDLTAWKKQEEQIIKLFPPSVVNSREFRMEKLQRLDAIYYSNGRGGSHEEKLMLRMLNIERKNLERQLFPKFWQRIFRGINGNSKIKAAAKQTDQHRRSNEQSLKDTLSKAGFGNINWHQVQQKLKQSDPSFTVTYSHYVNSDKRMEYELSFSKDQHGLYKFDQYLATLKSDAHPEQTKKQAFIVDAGNNTTTVQAFNLLEGRAVQQEYINALGGKQTAWVKLDFNDKDNHGNFKRREIHSHTDIEKILEAMPFREKTSYSEMEKLLQGLRNGERTAIHLMKDGNVTPLSLEVNPQLKTVDLFNHQGKKVPLSEALGEKKEKTQVVQLLQGHEEKQSRRTGLSVK